MNKTADAAIVRVAGAEGGGVPALTQTVGTKYQVNLGEVSTTVGGVCTCTPTTTRFLHFATKVSATMIDDAVITDAKMVAGTLTAASIANRTRKFFVPCVAVWNVTDSTAAVRALDMTMGWPMIDNKVHQAFGDFYVPSDYVSTMTATPVVISLATGNIYETTNVNEAADGQLYNTHDADGHGAVATAVTANKIEELTADSLALVAAADYVQLWFERTGTDALDTIGNTVYFKGWLVSYTADS